MKILPSLCSPWLFLDLPSVPPILPSSKPSEGPSKTAVTMSLKNLLFIVYEMLKEENDQNCFSQKQNLFLEGGCPTNLIRREPFPSLALLLLLYLSFLFPFHTPPSSFSPPFPISSPSCFSVPSLPFSSPPLPSLFIQRKIFSAQRAE